MAVADTDRNYHYPEIGESMSIFWRESCLPTLGSVGGRTPQRLGALGGSGPLFNGPIVGGKMDGGPDHVNSRYYFRETFTKLDCSLRCGTALFYKDLDEP